MTALEGCRILLTRAGEDCTEWATALEALGAVPVIFPCIECWDIQTTELRRQLADEIARATWIAFTSRRGVTAFAKNRRPGQPLPEPVRIAAVGPATAQEAMAELGRIDLEGEGGTAVALAGELVPRLDPADRVLIVVAESAGRALEDALASSGHAYARANVYRTAPKTAAINRLPASELGANTVFLASPSAVTGFQNQVRLDTPLDVFTIGPSTTRAAEAAGLDVAGEAKQPGLIGLMEALQCAN